MKGTLAPGILPRMLRDLYTGRRTGLLRVSQGDERRSVRFRKGHIVRAETNVAAERLGETLVRQGELSEDDLARATEVVIRDKKKLGVALQELGIMTRDRLDDALAVHVREMLRSLFGWHDGRYEFEDLESEEPVEGDISPRLPTGEMILEAVAAIGDAEIIRRELGNLNRLLSPSLDPMLRFQKITLTPSDGFLLSRVDGTLSAEQVLDLAPMDRDEAERSLFGLICTGLVEWQHGDSTPVSETEAGGAGDSAGEAVAEARERPEPPGVAEGGGEEEEEATEAEAAERAAEAEAAERAAEAEAAERAAEAEAAKRQAEAEAAKRQAEAEEAKRQAEAEEAKRQAEAEEAKRRAEAEEAKRRAEAEEAKRRAEAEEARRAAEAVVADLLAEAEAARRIADEAQRVAEEVRRTSEAEVARRAAEAEEAQRAAEEAQRLADETRRTAEAEVAEREAEAEEARGVADEAQLKVEEARRAAEAEEARRAAEAEEAKRAAEAKRAEEAEDARRAEEAEEARRAAEAEEAKRAAEAEEAKRAAEAEEARRAAEAEEARRAAEAEEARRAAEAEEEARRKAEKKDPETVRRELGDLERRVALAGDPTAHYDGMTPEDGFLLSRVDGTLRAREVLELSPMEREDAERSLLGLISKGLVAWVESASGKAERGARPERRREAEKTETPAPPEPPPTPKRPPEPEPDAALETERAERRREIEDLYGRLATMNHFEALDIPRASTEKEVKAAYFTMARRFHPDIHTDAGMADLEDKIEAIFIRVGEAYEVLRNRDKRADYESSLPRVRPAPGAAPAPAPAAAAEPEPAPPPEEAAPEMDPMQLAARVSGAFKVSARLYEEEKYFDAIRLLEQYIEVAKGPIRHRMRLLLAACKARNPAWAKNAEEDILVVLKEDPKNVQAHLQLGLLYKEKNLKARANSMFRKVLELDPENAAALAELEPATETKPQRESGGLLKKFFGRS